MRAAATAWHSDDGPGWIEVCIVDWLGEEHFVVEKVPVLTTLDVTPASSFPVELWLKAETVGAGSDDVTLTLLDGIETRDGETMLTVSSDDVVWL